MNKFMLILTSISLIGCASVGTKFSQSQIDKIIDGKTTKNEIIQMLGKPTMSYVVNDTIVMTYVRSTAKNSFGNFIPVYNVIHTEVNTDTETLTINIDNNDIVKSHPITQSSISSSSGLIP